MEKEEIQWNEPEEVQWKEKTEPSFGEKALAAGVAGLAGLASPMAGAAQLVGINRPAEVVRDVMKSASEVAPVAAPVAEFAGSVLSPLPWKLGSLAEKGVSMIPQAGKSIVARMGAQGATGAALSPLGTEKDKDYLNFLQEKAKQIGEGGVFGALVGKGTQAVLNPQVSEKMQMLKDLGMKYFTPGQLSSQIPFVGQALREGEAKSTSIPFVGSVIEEGIRTAASDMNKALANKVLANMGEKLPQNIKSGEKMIDYLNQRISDAYDAITPKLNIANLSYKDPTSPVGFTTTTKALTDKVRDLTQGMPSSKENNMAGIVQEEFNKYILEPLAKKGSMTGEEFRRAEKNLGNVAFSYMKNPQFYEVGSALRELQGELRKELIYQNPKMAKELRGIHDAFIQHLPIERAASYLGAEERIFSPAQLESAVKAQAKGKGMFASGKVPFYPESQAALSVMGKRIPDSGTAGRLGWATLPLHGFGTLPAAAAAGMIYNRPVMGALTQMATGKRPEIIQRLEPEISGGLARASGAQID